MSSAAPSSARSLLSLKCDVGGKLADVALISLQHLLPSIVPLFERFIAAGIDAQRLFVLGKPYSTVPAVAEALLRRGCHVHLPGDAAFPAGEYAKYFGGLIRHYWHGIAANLPAGVRKLVVLDEGGWLCRAIPESLVDSFEVVAIEHTMQGAFTIPEGAALSYPVVLMAASAAKTRFEGPVIADAVVERLMESLETLDGVSIGIIGLGNIGQAVAAALHARSADSLLGYDKLSYKGRELGFLERVSSLAQLVSRCDVLLGCTGRDSMGSGVALRSAGGRRRMASCSSGDVEFHRTLALLAGQRPALRANPFEDLRGMVGDTEVRLLNGGFPLNFDRAREREHAARIQLTRELTYASVMQAMLCRNDEHGAGGVMLDPEVQELIVEAWLATTDAGGLFPDWTPHSPAWWQKNSQGQRLSGSSLAEYIGLAAQPLSRPYGRLDVSRAEITDPTPSTQTNTK